MRCKMKVNKVSYSENGQEVEMTPVTNTCPENSSFFKWTPYGSLKLGIVNPNIILNPGEEYYLDFTKAE